MFVFQELQQVGLTIAVNPDDDRPVSEPFATIWVDRKDQPYRNKLFVFQELQHIVHHVGLTLAVNPDDDQPGSGPFATIWVDRDGQPYRKNYSFFKNYSR